MTIFKLYFCARKRQILVFSLKLKATTPLAPKNVCNIENKTELSNLLYDTHLSH